MAELDVAVIGYSEGEVVAGQLAEHIGGIPDTEGRFRFEVREFRCVKREPKEDLVKTIAKWVMKDERRCAIFLYGSTLGTEAAAENLCGMTAATVHNQRAAVESRGPRVTRIIFVGNSADGTINPDKETIKDCATLYLQAKQEKLKSGFIVGPEDDGEESDA